LALRVSMGLELLMAQEEGRGSSRVSLMEGLLAAAEGAQRAEWAPGRQALGVEVAAAPTGSRPPQETAERHPAAKLVGWPWGKLTEPRAGAPRVAAAVAEQPFGA
jgi:hypothetical protein